MNKQEKLDKINNKIQLLTLQRNDLNKELELENNKKLIGKCFSDWYDSDPSYYLYIRVDSIDQYGFLVGKWFKDYSGTFNTGAIEFSDPLNLVRVGDYINGGCTEITPDDFRERYNILVSHLTRNQ